MLKLDMCVVVLNSNTEEKYREINYIACSQVNDVHIGNSLHVLVACDNEQFAQRVT